MSAARRSSPPRPSARPARPRARARVENWRARRRRAAARSARRCTGGRRTKASACVRRSRGMRSITSACIGALTSDMKKPPQRDRRGRELPRPGIDHAPTATPSGRGTLPRPSASGSNRRTIRRATSAPTSAPPPSAPNSQPRTCGFAPYARHDEHRQRGEEELPADVEQRERGCPDAQEPVAQDEAHAVERAAAVVRRGDLRRVHEQPRRARTTRGRSQRRRRGCSPRRSTAIRTPASGGPRKIVKPVRSLEERGRRRRRRRALRRRAPARPPAARREYGAMKTPLAATSASSIGNGSTPSALRIGIAAKSGTRARSQTSIVRRVPSRAAIAPPQKPSTAIGHDLGDDHPRHALRRPGRAQHEPRQRDPGHLRADRRDDLRREERGEAAVAAAGLTARRRRRS